MFLKIKSYLPLFILLVGINAWSQQTDFIKGNEYILDKIKVTGLKNFNEQTVITYTGLKQGQKISEQKEAEILSNIKQKYDQQVSPYYSAARLWTDAIIDPIKTPIKLMSKLIFIKILKFNFEKK